MNEEVKISENEIILSNGTRVWEDPNAKEVFVPRDDQIDAVSTELEEIADNSITKKELAVMDELSDIENMSHKLELMSYIELKQFVSTIDSNLSQLNTLISLIDMVENIGDPLESLEDKMMVASTIHNSTDEFDINDYKEKIPYIKERLLSIKDTVQQYIDTNYANTVATTSFLTKEMVGTLNKAEEKAKKEIDKIVLANNTENDITPLVAEQLDEACVARYRAFLYTKRHNVMYFFIRDIFLNNLKEMKKTNRYIKNLYEKTFQETKESLADSYTPKKLGIFEKALQTHCNLEKIDTIRLFVFIKRIIDKPTHTPEETCWRTIITILIMNVADIESKIWDEDMAETPEYVYEQLKMLKPMLDMDVDACKKYIDGEEFGMYKDYYAK